MFPLGPRRPRRGRRSRAAASRPAAGTAGSRATRKPLSELPAAALAEEIDTPGDGQIKAMITIAGNPVLSAPDGDRLDRALDGVGFMLSIDPYLNETTRHADVILPPPPPSQSAAFRLRAEQPRGAQQRPVLAAGAAAADGRPDEAEILSRIALILYGVGVGRRPVAGRRAGDRDDAGQGDRRPRLAGGRSSGRRVDRDAARRARATNAAST